MPGSAGLQAAARSKYRAEAARKESESAALAPYWSANLGPQDRSVPSKQGPSLIPNSGLLVGLDPGEGPPRACVGMWASTK